MNRIRRFRYRTMYHRMTIEEMRKHEWVVSWSGGKDSTATILLMHENQIPIKEIIYIRMMFDDDLPATLPLMTDFVDRASEVFRSWGYKVSIIPSDKTALQLMSNKYQRSSYTDRNGKYYGVTAFIRGSCNLTGVKVKTINRVMPNDCFEMIGYAADEDKRIHRLNCSNKYSIMVQLGIKEEETFDICKTYDLLSPLYELKAPRDGCWFCPNASKRERS